MTVVIELLGWVVVWQSTQWIVEYVVQIPPKIKQLDDTRQRRRATAEYHGYFLSLFHAVFMIVMCGYCILVNPITPNRPFLPVEILVFRSSFGYFIVETVNGYLKGFNDVWMNTHHFVMIACYSQAIVYDNCAVENCFAMLFGELSNPFNILRQVFDAWKEEKKSKIMSIIFIILFIPLRVIVCPAICHNTIYNESLSYVLKLNSGMMVFVGYIWIWRVVNLGVKQLAAMNADSKAIQSVYTFVKSIRPYEYVWILLSACIPTYWVACSVYYDVRGWPSK